jgi:purine-nucleoside phosphorylase
VRLISNRVKTRLAIILGSGLDVIVDSITSKRLLSHDYKGIHKKRTYIAEINGIPVLVFCGRKHFYERFLREELTDNVKIAKEFGTEYLLITNAAGGLNINFRESDLMIISSYINFNPKLYLPKKRINYNTDYYEKFKKVCSGLKIRLFDGVYGCLPGPAYETPSEIRMLKKFGADAVGMSTIPEVFAAQVRGIRVLAISVITNILKENDNMPLSHKHVLESSRRASEPLGKAIFRLVSELN